MMNKDEVYGVKFPTMKPLDSAKKENSVNSEGAAAPKPVA